MWLTDLVEIPDELIEARSDKALVVFVGAGASVGPPSDLPIFDRLAELIAEDLHVGPYNPKQHGGPDEYLEHLEREGRPMRDRLIARLGTPTSKHNALHAAIVRLFTDLGSLRIVTTNYDPHLTSATTARFGQAPTVYGAPALPLGRDFSGIVYLHGQLGGRPKDLVISSRDFGRAYLTDAWAARFLNELFREYTTLFVGYSHRDVVMSYLARGLRPGSRRFGFITDAEDVDGWRPLELQPVKYPFTPDHAELVRALEAWGNWTRMGLLDHERRVETLMAKGTPQTPSEKSYLERIIANDLTTGYFVKYATVTEWLDWIVERPPFPSLFAPGKPLGKAAIVLAHWFAGFALTDSERALVAVQRHGGVLNETVASYIALLYSKQRPAATALGRWLALLTSGSLPELTLALGCILSDSRWPEDRDVALFLFDRLIERRLELRPSFQLYDDSASETVEFNIDALVGDDHWLRESWRQFFKPNLAELITDLVLILEYRLSEGHELLRMVGQAGTQWDTESFQRSAIEPDAQDQPGWPFSFVIDCLRDCLEVLLIDHPAEGAALVGRLERSDVPLLRRLAVHGWTKRADVSADVKLRHAVASGWLFAFPSKREVYGLIASVVPDATDARSELLNAVLAGPPEELALGDGRDDSLVVDLLAHIVTVALDFPEATAALEEFQAAHPGLHPSEHLGYSLWIGPSGFGTTLPVSVEELLGCDNAHAIDELLARQYSTDPQAFAWGFRLPEAIASTTAQRPAWGRAIMSDLLATGSWDSQYWAWVLSGLALSGAQIGDDMLLPVCGLLADVIGHIPEHSALASTLRPISQFLMSAVNRPSMPIESLGALERLGALVAATASLGPLDSVTEEPEGVLDRASNDWTGWFTRFWIDATSLRWKIEEETWSALPAGTRTALEAVLNAPGPTSVYPQSILAAKYDFWAAADEQWTREHIRPLFSWEHDAVRAVRAWSSFVDGASLNERVLRHLREDFHGAFRAFRGRLGAKFAKRFAEVMVRSNSDYVSDGTLADFVAMSDEDMRGVFARQVGWWLLHQTTESYSESQWSRWIENYLITRIAAVPLPLSPSEAASMISWVVASGKYFPRAVSLYTESDPQFAQTFDVWRDISKFHLADTYPSDLAHLLNFILARTERSSFYSCDDIGKLLAKLMEHLTSDARPVLLSICESAARLSCGHASAWRSAVDTRWPS